MTITTSTRATARDPEQVAALLAACTAAGDVDGAVTLFEPGALLLTGSGESAREAVELRAACTRLCADGVRLQVRTDEVHVTGELALVSSTWTGTTISSRDGRGGRSYGVLRRQPDGRWLAVVLDLRGSTS